MLANRLVEIRNSRSMTQSEVAAASGISRSKIQRIEHDRAKPNVDDLHRLAAVYGCEPQHLLQPYGEEIPRVRYRPRDAAPVKLVDGALLLGSLPNGVPLFCTLHGPSLPLDSTDIQLFKKRLFEARDDFEEGLRLALRG